MSFFMSIWYWHWKTLRKTTKNDKLDAIAEKKNPFVFFPSKLFFYFCLYCKKVLFIKFEHWDQKKLNSMGFLWYKSWCWKEISKEKKAILKNKKKMIDFLESKTERSKFYDKKEKKQEQTFITTQLLLWPRSLSYYIHP